ncbi:reverse transcriptase domain-containing protein [Tanacetum coccineum]
MFRQTLGGVARNWFDDLDPNNVDSFEEPSQKFLEEFSQQKRYAKDPTEIHGIKRRQNEGLQAFMDRFKSESSHIKGVPSVLHILAFMHGHGHSELAKKLNDKIPKMVDEMFERVRAFIRGEVAVGSAKMKPQCQRPVKTQKMQSSNGRFFGRNISSPGSNRSSSNYGKSRRNQIRMMEDDKEKTRFHMEEGVYCFTHMPKELKNSTATLQRMMEEVLADQKGRNVEIYLEEIVIKSKSELDLVQDVKETLRKLKRVNIKIDPVMSSFGVKEGRLPGFMVTKEGVRAEPEKVQAIILNPTPKSPNQIQSLFLQLTAISKFILKMAELQYPIRKVQMRFETTEGSGWMNEAEKALQRIKRKLNKLQTLAVPKEGEILMLCLRQKDETISYVLLVEREGIQIPVSYVS